VCERCDRGPPMELRYRVQQRERSTAPVQRNPPPQRSRQGLTALSQVVRANKKAPTPERVQSDGPITSPLAPPSPAVPRSMEKKSHLQGRIHLVSSHGDATNQPKDAIMLPVVLGLPLSSQGLNRVLGPQCEPPHPLPRVLIPFPRHSTLRSR